MFRDLREIISNSVFKITVYENRLYINNYDEILVLKDNEIVLKSKNKSVTIIGKNLIITRLNSQEVLIKGAVERIDLGD